MGAALATNLDAAWMTTVSGREVNLLAFGPEDINVDDIGHALSNVNRFGGHALFPVSVGLHSCNLVDIVPNELKKAAFAHDWSEAFVNDLVSDLKKMCPDYQRIEDNIQMVIFDALGIPWEHMAAVHPYDKSIGRCEWRQLFRPGQYPVETVPLEELSWRDVRTRFHRTYKELFT